MLDLVTISWVRCTFVVGHLQQRMVTKEGLRKPLCCLKLFQKPYLLSIFFTTYGPWQPIHGAVFFSCQNLCCPNGCSSLKLKPFEFWGCEKCKVNYCCVSTVIPPGEVKLSTPQHTAKIQCKHVSADTAVWNKQMHRTRDFRLGCCLYTSTGGVHTILHHWKGTFADEVQLLADNSDKMLQGHVSAPEARRAISCRRFSVGPQGLLKKRHKLWIREWTQAFHDFFLRIGNSFFLLELIVLA